MPRKSKEEIENSENKTIKSTNKKAATNAKKDTTSAPKTPSKKTSVKTTTSTKKSSAKETIVATKKTTTRKSTASAKKESSKKATSTVKKTTTKKKTTTTKKLTAKRKKTSATSTKKIWPVEYYDLPQKYNQTVIKVLAQTPKTLFIYWEISDDDIEKFKKEYGENFFETTKPVLIIHNDTLNYSFEVEINDFANSWYLHVNDSKSDYRIELGRRPFQINEKIKTDYIYITSSNEIESPNDHILFNKSQKMVYFRNVKTNIETAKPITSLSFIKNMGKIYEIYDLYQELYKNEENIEELTNPSSHTSSQFK